MSLEFRQSLKIPNLKNRKQNYRFGNAILLVFLVFIQELKGDIIGFLTDLR